MKLFKLFAFSLVAMPSVVLGVTLRSGQNIVTVDKNGELHWSQSGSVDLPVVLSSELDANANTNAFEAVELGEHQQEHQPADLPVALPSVELDITPVDQPERSEDVVVFRGREYDLSTIEYGDIKNRIKQLVADFRITDNRVLEEIQYEGSRLYHIETIRNKSGREQCVKALYRRFYNAASQSYCDGHTTILCGYEESEEAPVDLSWKSRSKAFFSAIFTASMSSLFDVASRVIIKIARV